MELPNEIIYKIAGYVDDLFELAITSKNMYVLCIPLINRCCDIERAIKKDDFVLLKPLGTNRIIKELGKIHPMPDCERIIQYIAEHDIINHDLFHNIVECGNLSMVLSATGEICRHCEVHAIKSNNVKVLKHIHANMPVRAHVIRFETCCLYPFTSRYMVKLGAKTELFNISVTQYSYELVVKCDILKPSRTHPSSNTIYFDGEDAVMFSHGLYALGVYRLDGIITRARWEINYVDPKKLRRE